jgi:hypothetical protein
MIFLVFEGNELEIHGYLDINSQSDIDDSKSQLEYIFTLNENTVSWKNSKKKKKPHQILQLKPNTSLRLRRQKMLFGSRSSL